MRAEMATPEAVPFDCADCGKPTAMLHNRPNEFGRKVCGGCQGRANRSILDQASECVRTLKTATDPQAERRAELDLISLLGREHADATISAVAKARAEGKYSNASATKDHRR